MTESQILRVLRAVPRPGVELITGSMYSGKSEELMRRVRHALHAGHRVEVFNNTIDNRYGDGIVASHSGISIKAISVSNAVELKKALKHDTNVVAIDEVQFFDEGIVDLCFELAEKGMRVIVAGLNSDFRGEVFGFMDRFMKAHDITTLHAICEVCGHPASMTQRLVEGEPARFDDPIIFVGKQEAYEARCPTCHVCLPPRGE